jgi:hypothetical protein
MRLDEVTYMQASGFLNSGELVPVEEVAQQGGTEPPFVV